jgi:hypothetical protein
VQQETDINYGPLKSVVWRNLAKILMTCYAIWITMLFLGTSTSGLIVYCGVCPDSGISLENVLGNTFNKVSNLHLWSKVGIVPFTQKCLANKKVCHDGMDKDNPDFDEF